MHVNSSANRDTNQNYSYRIGDLIVPYVSSFTDLGVCYDDKLRFKPHIDQMVAKASLRAKLILKCFQSREIISNLPKLLTKAFCVFVGPILEYANAIWNPHYKNQISKIEGVQRFFFKRFHGLWSHPYRSRLAQLGLDSLYCRIKADLLVCYKILHRRVYLNCDD